MLKQYKSIEKNIKYQIYSSAQVKKEKVGKQCLLLLSYNIKNKPRKKNIVYHDYFFLPLKIILIKMTSAENNNYSFKTVNQLLYTCCDIKFSKSNKHSLPVNFKDLCFICYLMSKAIYMLIKTFSTCTEGSYQKQLNYFMNMENKSSLQKI